MPKTPPSWFNSSGHDDHVKWVMDQEVFYRDCLQVPFDEMNKMWRLYMADKADLRKKHEQWRANVTVPLPFANIESGVATLSDIMLSSDPWVQAEGVEQKDEETARDVTKFLDYFLRSNRWPRKQDDILRQMSIQGFTMPKLVYGEVSKEVDVYANLETRNAWRQSVKEAEQATGTMAPIDPDEFDIWKENVEAILNRRLPDIPVSGAKKIVRYKGPIIIPIPITDLRYDPLVSDINDHELIIHRVVKPRSWVEERTGNGPGFIFDPKQVAQAMGSGGDNDKLNEWRQEQANLMGVSAAQVGDPMYQDAVELWECHHPNREEKFSVILNRQRVINKNPMTSPYMHGEAPFFPVRNVPVPNQLHGQSELRQTRKLYLEMDTLRSLRLDAVLLSVMPAFARQREVGLSESQREIRPGAIIDVSRVDAIKQLIQIGGLDYAFREIPEIKADINEAYGTYENLKGAQSTVGRVSATESERRFSQAQTRQKQRAVRFEEELNPMISQALMLMYQYYDEATMKEITGGTSKLKAIPQESFLAALEMNFRFRGATKALNRDMQVQQLTGYLTEFGALMTAKEKRTVMQRILEASGTKGIDQIVTDAGTKQMEAMEQVQVQGMLQQAAAAAAPTPPTVSGGAADAVAAEAGPAEAPPEGAPVESEQPSPEEALVPPEQPEGEPTMV